jgi:hypothetical protein
MMRMKNVPALAAALLAVAFAAGCSSKADKSGSGDSPTGSFAKAKVAVSAAATQTQIKSIKLTIVDTDPTATPPGVPGAGFPITAFLTLAPAGNVWTGNITNIPAAVAGSSRWFTATAYDAVNGGGNAIYTGTTLATVIAGATAQVTIMLQETQPPTGPANNAPVIDSLTATAAYVLPGTKGSFSVTAHDPDDASHLNRAAFNGEPLAYQWSAACTSGAMTLTTPTQASTAFVAPAVSSSVCTVAIKVSETALANNSSVTTYFTVTVNGNYGNADVFGFPNSTPLVTVSGDFTYYPFADVSPSGVPEQRGNLHFAATDADGDNVRFDLAANCSDNGFDGAGNLMSPVFAVTTNYFSAATFTTTGGAVSPPAQSSFSWNPTFGAPGATLFNDPSASCSFQIVVHDLCTSGNCGAGGSFGAKADGQDKGSLITGLLNTQAPAVAKRAPTITRVNPANQAGGLVAGAMTWDPQKSVVVVGTTAYNLSLDAEDTYANGTLSVAVACNQGTPANITPVVGTGKTLHYEGSWTSPAVLAPDMHCTYTVTSADTGLATATTVYYVSTDPCVGKADGLSCSTGNKCKLGETCQSGICTAPAGTVSVANGATAPTTGTGTVGCSAGDVCHVSGVCDANTGVCSNPVVTVATACDADGSGCTVNDSCNLSTGACEAGPAPITCPNAIPNAFCYDGTKTPAQMCVSSGASSFTCAWPVLSGASCTVGNAAAKCTGANTFSSFACDATGACVGSGSQACTNTTCASGNSCQAATGACGGGTFASVNTVCDDGRACTGSGAIAPLADHCDGAGACVAGTGLACAAGQGCSEPTGSQTGPQCGDSVVTPFLARRLDLATSVGLGMDTSGNSYVTGTLGTPTKYFGALNPVNEVPSLTSGGAGDVFLGSYDASGALRWVINYGDSADQQPAGLAVSSTGVLAHGRFGGLIANGPVNLNAGASTWDYVVFANPATGALTAGQAIDTGLSGVILGAGANQASGEYAVCGKASKLALIGGTATQWGAGSYGGSNDILIGVYNADGSLRWAKQIGTASDEECDAVTIDAVGNVVATGVYSGTAPNLAFTGAALPNPGSSFRRWMWVATFNGTTGAGISQAAFGGGAGQHKPNAIALDSAGNILVAANFGNTIPFDGTNTACTAGAVGCLASDGGVDGVVMKLSPALAPIWATRVGVSTADDSIRGVAVDSYDNVTVVGLLNGSATASTVTPTTAATAAVTDPALTSAGGSASSFLMKLPGTTGLFNPATTKATGNSTTSNSNKVAINRLGTGTVKDAASFCGEFASGSLSFGGSSSTVTSPSGASTFLVFAKEQ